MKYIKFVILFFVSLIVRFFVRIDENILMFSARGGMGFEDNAKYLFLYVNQYTSYNAIWITKNKKVFNYLQKKGYNVLYFFSAKALVMSLKAKAVFITHSITDVMPVLYNKRTIIINLWHGIPIKKIEFLDKNQKVKNLIIDSIKAKRLNYLISNSFYFNEIYKRSFHININKIKTLGLPRIEFLRNPNLFIPELQSPFPNNKTIFLYAPTFRDYEYDFEFLSGNDIVILDEKLSKENSILYIKFHPLEKYNFKGDFKNIKLFDFESDIYEVLPFVNIFISDYSSLTIDFLVAYPNRQLKIYVPDIEIYMKERGIYFDFEKNFKSYIIANFTDVLDASNKVGDLNPIFYEDFENSECKSILKLL